MFSIIYNHLSSPKWGSPGGSDGKESAWNVGDWGSTPGLGISPGEGHGNPLQYSCLEYSTEDAGELLPGVTNTLGVIRTLMSP